ncbi:hypothetical protein C4D60_Mb10t27640 [Musa balbisiana]|uniref:60S ribosomal protein L36 n=1 Tax=Musa balbisiana TaxID=52838 RepID=A0A4S8J0C5_MUSBA|nr:hypothetical protein C4D60_Mb10t27640 [Musa balbisiana]
MLQWTATHLSTCLSVQSTGSFFHDRSSTLGSLIGITSILDLSNRSLRRSRQQENPRANKNRKTKTWFSLCARTQLSGDVTDASPSLGSFLEAERRASNARQTQVMAPPQPNTGLFVGLNKGHIVTKRELPPRPSNRKGKTSKRVHFVRNIIREVAGFAPYEKRITELLKVGKDKRALKVAKRKLGTHKRAKKKREEMANVLRKMKEGYKAGSGKKEGYKAGSGKKEGYKAGSGKKEGYKAGSGKKEGYKAGSGKKEGYKAGSGKKEGYKAGSGKKEGYKAGSGKKEGYKAGSGKKEGYKAGSGKKEGYKAGSGKKEGYKAGSGKKEGYKAGSGKKEGYKAGSGKKEGYKAGSGKKEGYKAGSGKKEGEVAGFAPYEKRITELLKVGKDKRALKVAKRKLGTHKRAKKKREEMANVLRKMRYSRATIIIMGSSSGSSKKFGGGRPPTGTPSLAWSCVVVVASLLAGASLVHNIYKPDLTLPPVDPPAAGENKRDDPK